ncbi:hypothetical protein [Pseudoalteromonas gelatinilytica]
MEYQDSHPERRNLMVIALGIMIYIIGDGKITNNILKIQAISIEFEDTAKVVYFVWVAFFWSLYRYWVVSKGEVKKMFDKELSQFRKNKLIKKICNKSNIVIADEKTEGGYFIQDLYHTNKSLYIRTAYCRYLVWSDGYAKPKNSYGSQHEKSTKVGIINSINISIKIFVGKRTFSDFIVPYFIAYITTLIFFYEVGKKISWL